MTRTTLDYIYKRPKGPVSDEFAITRRILGMTDESIKRDVRELSQWLRDQPDLPNKLDGVNLDWWLENYLVMNKNEVERVKINMPEYFKLKNTVPEVMVNRDPRTNIEMIKGHRTTLLAITPVLLEGGRKLVVYSHRANTPPSDYSPVGVATTLTCVADYFFATGLDFVKLELIVDLESFRLAHLARYPLGLLRRFFFYAWKAYPLRVSHIHIINPPTILSAVLGLFKPLMKKKIRKRIVVHRHFESLLEYVPLKYLPEDYGGETPPMIELHEQLRQIVIDHQPYLKTSAEKHRVLEKTKNGSS